MSKRDNLTADYVRQILDYNQITGELFWKNRPEGHFKNIRSYKIWNTRFQGKLAGNASGRGYREIGINGISYRTHRLAWLWMTGEWPMCHVDHIDLDRANNSWINLRQATNSQNLANRRKTVKNKTGFKGVTMHIGLYRATIGVSKKVIFLGYRNTPEEAYELYKEAAIKYYGEFARL